MPSETRTCQNCKQAFAVEPGDFDFYQKLEVPPPTFCPQCRLQRRLAWRNERFLYSRQCSGTQKNVISVYDKDTQFPVYGREYWYSDAWDATDCGRDYDFNRSFFEQFADLARKAPRLQLWQVNSSDSDYSNYIVDSKNCYLCFTALGGNEDCAYSSYMTNSTGCYDCHLINKCESCYECLNCADCYNVKHSVDSRNCRDSWFLMDCNNCSNCFGCAGLKDKQYHIFNEAYTKEEYERKLGGFNLTSRENITDIKNRVEALALRFPKRFMHGYKNTNASGDYVNNSNDVHDAYLSNNCEECKNIYFCLSAKSARDVTVSTLTNEILYECHAIPKSNYFMRFCDLCSNGSKYLEYCDNSDGCSNCFGCIGLRGKEYCILNKQYSKEEYEALRTKIIAQMNEKPYTDQAGRTYRYGEFFPIELSPFAYNESVAAEYFPLSKNQVAEKKYRWKDLNPKNYQITVNSYEIRDKTADLTEDVCREILGCQHEGSCDHNCSQGFRITPQDLQFYKKSNLPLPKLCPNCRHCERFNQRNPLALWPRKCQCAGEASEGEYKNITRHFHEKDHCPNEFQTSYAPERPEIVYCEQCYQAEVA